MWGKSRLRQIKVGKAVPARVLEKTRQKNIVRYLKAVPGCKAEVRTQTGYGTKGGADILGCINGRHFELEVKQPGNKPTPLQVRWLQEWAECGAITGCVENVDMTRQVFRDHGLEI
jgi:hypothetical protein